LKIKVSLHPIVNNIEKLTKEKKKEKFKTNIQVEVLEIPFLWDKQMIPVLKSGFK